MTARQRAAQEQAQRLHLALDAPRSDVTDRDLVEMVAVTRMLEPGSTGVSESTRERHKDRMMREFRRVNPHATSSAEPQPKPPVRSRRQWVAGQSDLPLRMADVEPIDQGRAEAVAKQVAQILHDLPQQ